SPNPSPPPSASAPPPSEEHALNASRLAVATTATEVENFLRLFFMTLLWVVLLIGLFASRADHRDEAILTTLAKPRFRDRDRLSRRCCKADFCDSAFIEPLSFDEDVSNPLRPPTGIVNDYD